MKKKLFALALLICCFFLVSCTKETTALSAKKSFFYLALDGSVNIEDYLIKEGNGDLNISIENTEVLKLDGTTLRGIAVGRGAVIVESSGFIVRIGVEVVDTKKVVVSVFDGEREYDGEAHFPAVNGTLPEGSTVRFLHNGEVFSGAVNAGRYELTADISVPEPYYVEYKKRDCVYVIHPKQYDLSGVYFSTSTYTYDGTEKSLVLRGSTLPAEIKVSYENNVGTEAGTYHAVATLTVPDENNYVPISPMKADLIIRQQYVNVASLGFSSATYQYDGTGHAVRFADCPDGMEIEYSTYRNNAKVPLTADYLFTDSGEYPIYATLTITPFLYRNYAFYSDELMSFSAKGGKFVSDTDAYAALNVRKSSFYNDYRWSLADPSGSAVTSVPYGKEISLGGETGYVLRIVGSSHGTNGEFPQGATVSYSSSMRKNGFGNVNSGSYTITASFTMPEGSSKNYNQIADLYYSLTIARVTIDGSGLIFAADPAVVEYDPDAEYSFAVDGSAMDNFDSLLSVEYTYKKNGLKMSSAEKVGAAAEYDIVATFTVIGEDKDNYNPPAAKTLRFVIEKRTVSMDVTFRSVEGTYRGTPYLLEVEGELPEGVTVTYACGRENGLTSVAYTDAGRYNVIAVFKYKNWISDNYVLTDADGKAFDLFMLEDGKVYYGKEASLVIDKAEKELTEAMKAQYVQSEIPVYSEDLTAGDIALDGNENGYVRLVGATEKISLGGYDVSTHKAWFNLSAIYNEDEKNYYDVPFTIKCYVYQKAINLTDVSVPSQFVAYTGKTVVPVVKCSGAFECGELLSASVASTASTDLISVGSHPCTVTLTLKQDKNAGYYLDGSGVYADVTLYVYNAAQFDYSPATTSLAEYRGGDRNVTVPEGTTGLQKNAFASAGRVEKLVLPNSLTTIAEGALSGAVLLSELSLPRYFNLNVAFKNAVPGDLTTVIVRSGSSVEERAFFKQVTLQKIVYESEVTTVGQYAFSGCTALTEVVFPNVPDYAENAFSGCSGLQTLTVKEFSSPAYYFGPGINGSYELYSLERLTVTEGTALAEGAFRGLSSLTQINLPTGLTSVGRYAFSGVQASVDLSSSTMTTLGEYAFSGFAGDVVLPGTLTELSSFAFSDCRAQRLILPKNVATIGANAFSGCTSALVFATDSLLTNVGAQAFRGYAGETISLPASVTTLGTQAFENSSIVSFAVPSTMTIGVGCFKNCKSLETVTICCLSVPENAFSGCEVLRSITFDGTTVIDNNAFYGCGALSAVVLPATLTEIGATAFSGCPLETVTMTAEEPPAVIKTGVFPTDRAIRFTVPEVRYAEYVAYIRGVGCDMGKCTVNGRSPG